MALSNLANVVEHLGVPFTSLIARKDILTFSINQLNILKDISRKISKIDPLDSNYPNNQILVKFIKNGSRVLEESISLVNRNHSNSNLPHINGLFKNNRTDLNRKNDNLNKSNNFSNHTSKDKTNNLETLLNDTLISFVNILCNSGYFYDHLEFLKSILKRISVGGLNYSGLVCMVGIVNKCDLFRLEDFNYFSKSIFSYFNKNRRILKYLNDLDTSLLLFHKISMLYMTKPGLSAVTGHLKTEKNTNSSELFDLMVLLEASIDKAHEILRYTNVNEFDQNTKMPIKSVHNLIQSIFLIYYFDKNLLFKLKLDKLSKINLILLENSRETNCGSESHQPTQTVDKHSKFIYNKDSIHINNTSSLHTKIGQTLNRVLDTTQCPVSETDPSTVGSDDNSNSSTQNTTESKYRNDKIGTQEQGKPKILNEVRIGSSMYFVDMLVT